MSYVRELLPCEVGAMLVKANACLAVIDTNHHFIIKTNHWMGYRVASSNCNPRFV
jgi:hypothetical protein